jgi:hypothetical protein
MKYTPETVPIGLFTCNGQTYEKDSNGVVYHITKRPVQANFDDMELDSTELDEFADKPWFEMDPGWRIMTMTSVHCNWKWVVPKCPICGTDEFIICSSTEERPISIACSCGLVLFYGHATVPHSNDEKNVHKLIEKWCNRPEEEHKKSTS